MMRLFELIDARDEDGSVQLIKQWFDSVDAELVRIIELALTPPDNTQNSPTRSTIEATT
jgi:hypothetical protein